MLHVKPVTSDLLKLKMMALIPAFLTLPELFEFLVFRYYKSVVVLTTTIAIKKSKTTFFSIQTHSLFNLKL